MGSATSKAGKGHSKGGYRSSHMHRATNGAASASVEWEFKVIVAGNRGSGKTSVIRRYTANQYTPVEGAHTEVDPGTEPQLPQLTTISLRVPGTTGITSATFWDVPAGVEDFMKAEIYSDADAIIIVVDVTDPLCTKVAWEWNRNVLEHASASGVSKVPFVLLANKTDELLVGKEEFLADLSTAVEQNGFVACLGVSSRSGDGSVHRAVDGLLRGLVERQRQEGTVKCYPSTGNSSSCSRRKKTALPFAELGVKESDELLVQCWREVQNIHSWKSSLQAVVSQFTQACVSEGLVPPDNQQSNLIEHCIAAVRASLRTEDSLQVDCGANGGFPRLLVVPEKRLFKAGPAVVRVLQLYQEKLYPFGAMILTNIPLTLECTSNCQQELDSLAKERQLFETKSAMRTGATSTAHTPTTGRSKHDLKLMKSVTQCRAAVTSWEDSVKADALYTERLAQKILTAALWEPRIS